MIAEFKKKFSYAQMYKLQNEMVKVMHTYFSQ